jgi:AhpD family alkylhydroperoxidase
MASSDQTSTDRASSDKASTDRASSDRASSGATSSAGAGPDSYRARVARSAAAGRKLSRHQPELHQAYWKVNKLAMQPGALDQATKELIALALVVQAHCDVCVSYHVRDCLAAGCTVEQIYETLNVAIAEGDGPTMVYAGYAVEAVDEYLATGSGAGAGQTDAPPPHRH